MDKKDKKINKKISKDNSKTTTKKAVKKKKRRLYPLLIISILIIAIVAYAFYINKDLFLKKSEGALIVAKVNNDGITLEELNEAYNRLSDEYKQLITKESLLDEIVAERLLLQEAEKQGIAVAAEEAANIIDEALMQSNISDEEFKSKLDNNLKIARSIASLLL